MRQDAWTSLHHYASRPPSRDTITQQALADFEALHGIHPADVGRSGIAALFRDTVDCIVHRDEAACATQAPLSGLKGSMEAFVKTQAQRWQTQAHEAVAQVWTATESAVGHVEKAVGRAVHGVEVRAEACCMTDSPGSHSARQTWSSTMRSAWRQGWRTRLLLRGSLCRSRSRRWWQGCRGSGGRWREGHIRRRMLARRRCVVACRLRSMSWKRWSGLRVKPAKLRLCVQKNVEQRLNECFVLCEQGSTVYRLHGVTRGSGFVCRSIVATSQPSHTCSPFCRTTDCTPPTYQ